MARESDRARLVSNGATDRLTDPPRGVRRELVAPAVVELLGGSDKTDRALLDQVQKRQPLIAVVLRDRDDQPQVGLDHPLLGVQLAALDPLGEIDLLLGGQQSRSPDVLEKQLQRVRSPARLEAQPYVAIATPLGRPLDSEAPPNRWVELLDQVDSRPLKDAMQILSIGLIQIDVGRRGRDLDVREHADPPAARDQSLYLVKLL